ncbi:hypothetical protein LUZ60_004500 [Juncus effusus]|nr:hypothetical protein LUZ60_004500 [Juncus effusus]
MEKLVSFDSILFWTLFLILSFLFLFLKLKSAKPGLKLPPSPWSLPIVGHIHHLIGSLPHHALRLLSFHYGPILFLRLGEIRTVIVSSPEAATKILKTHDITFATRPLTTTMRIFTDNGKGLVFTPYGEYWQQLRKICILELLSPRRVRSFRSIREEESQTLIQSILSSSNNVNKAVNIRDRVTVTMNNITVRAVIGSKCKDQDLFLHEMDIEGELGGGFNLIDLFPSSRIVRVVSVIQKKAEQSWQRLDQFLDGVIEQHNKKKASDSNRDEDVETLLDVMMRISDEGALQFPLTGDVIKAIISDVFGAGSETSSTTLEWAMAELIQNPRVMGKAQSEIRELLKGCAKVSESDLVKLNYLHLVIKETLRLHPAAPLLLPRQCRETCRISGYDIPQGATVLVNVWAIGRDPKYWKDPEEFKPERFIDKDVDFKGTDFEFLPFGAGRRMCPGVAFGLANVELPLASLLYHFDWKLSDSAETEEIDMSESFGITARKKTPLNLLAVPYKSGVGIDD